MLAKLLICCLTSSIVFAAETLKSDQITTEKDGVKMNWKVSLPLNYNEERVWPLIVTTFGANCAHVDQDSWTLFTQAGYFFALAEKNPGNIKKLNDWAELVTDAAKQAQAKYKIDPSRIFTLGFSVYGVSAMYTALNNAQTFSGAISVCHIYPNNVLDAKKIGKPLSFLVISGNKDYKYPLQKSG